MKKITFKNLFLIALAIMGLQVANAQYLGYPFGGTAPIISNTPGMRTIIEMENFDSTDMAGTNDGASYYDPTTNNNTVQPPDNVVASYYDRSSGNLGTSALRPNGDVDIDEIDNGDGTFKQVVGQNQGNEFQMYTVTIAQSGNYSFGINYAHTNTTQAKRVQVWLRDISDLSADFTLMNLASDQGLPPTASSTTYADFEDPDFAGGIDITAGTYVMHVRHLAGGPRFDYVYFDTNTVLSTNDFDASSVFVSNPVNKALTIKGLTNNIEQVSIYSLLGNRVLESKVDGKSSLELDVNSLSSGMYIVRMTGDNVSFSKKIVKQ